jgi:hypothetical protein
MEDLLTIWKRVRRNSFEKATLVLIKYLAEQFYWTTSEN